MCVKFTRTINWFAKQDQGQIIVLSNAHKLNLFALVRVTDTEAKNVQKGMNIRIHLVNVTEKMDAQRIPLTVF